MERLSENLYRFVDTCNVYAIRTGDEAILIDFGAGDILDELPEIGVDHVVAVLMTHHHRDQGQGLNRAVEAGAKIWVPGAEQELFSDVEQHWQSRLVWNNYNVREDRFSIRDSVPVDGLLPEYRKTLFGKVAVTTIPLPGHTVGSVGFLVHVDGKLVAFTGDLIAGPGKVWSLASTQWSYAGSEGLATSVLSLLDLADRDADLLAPSHGQPMTDPPSAIRQLVGKLLELLELRAAHTDLLQRHAQPYKRLLPHLLWNWTGHAHSYVLLSDSGKAMMIDYGYDVHMGLAAGTDRASRRPWLYTIPKLRQEFGVRSIDVAVPTHYHDDHIAGFNLLRQVEGAEIWAPENCEDVMRRPEAYDLPCLWYEPVEIDRVLPLGEPVRWEEHELIFHPLPGHTLHAVGIETTVDGKTLLFTGDQHDGDGRLNYVYQNRFRISDYRVTGDLYLRVNPDVLLTGHWGPGWVEGDLLAEIRDRGARLERLHRELLPLQETDFGAEGFGAWIRPYQSEVPAGDHVDFQVEVRNPFPQTEKVSVTMVVPYGWRAEPASDSVEVDPGEHGHLSFRVTPEPKASTRRAVVMADLQVGERRFGQHAEALVTVV